MTTACWATDEACAKLDRKEDFGVHAGSNVPVVEEFIWTPACNHSSLCVVMASAQTMAVPRLQSRVACLAPKVLEASMRMLSTAISISRAMVGKGPMQRVS